MDTRWHFPIMIGASYVLFLFVIRGVVGRKSFKEHKSKIFLLGLLIVVGGMLFGKYGANFGLPWWVYYPLPMLMNVLLPPLVLKMNTSKTLLYLLLAFLSAPLIHVFFSFIFGWTEYMPFWKINSLILFVG